MLKNIPHLGNDLIGKKMPIKRLRFDRSILTIGESKANSIC